jgi:hypothetical protein
MGEPRAMGRSNSTRYILVITGWKVFRGDGDNVARTPSSRADRFIEIVHRY